MLCANLAGLQSVLELSKAFHEPMKIPVDNERLLTPLFVRRGILITWNASLQRHGEVPPKPGIRMLDRQPILEVHLAPIFEALPQQIPGKDWLTILRLQI